MENGRTIETGHTSEMCQVALIEDLEQLFEGREFTGQEGPKELKIFKQFVSIPEDDDEDADTDAANTPCIIVKIQEGVFEKAGEAQKVMVQLVIAAYDTNKDRQGYVDVVNIKEAITQHFLEKPAFGGAFTVLYPIAWAIQDEDTAPYYWGVVNFFCSAPAKKNTQVEDLI